MEAVARGLTPGVPLWFIKAPEDHPGVVEACPRDHSLFASVLGQHETLFPSTVVEQENN